ncbi:MAG: glycosyltransferase family 39 protein [Acidimicrobiia bacterium]
MATVEAEHREGTAAEGHPASPGPAGGLTPAQRRWLVAILVAAAGVRLAWALYATQEPIRAIGGDAYSYYYYGKELAAGDGYVNYLTGEPTAYYPIGYPAILAGLFWFVRHTPIPDNLPVAGSLLNAVLGTLSVGLVFVIVRRLFDARVGLVAAAITAVFPNLVFYVATFQIETTFIFLALAAVAVIVTHDWSTGPPGRARLMAFGAVFGLSALVRPFSLPLLLALVVAVLAAGYGWRRALAALGWPLLALVVMLMPWTVRNIVVMDAPIVFSTNMGDTLCLDRSLDATGQFRFATHAGCAAPDTPEVKRNSESTRRAIEFVLEHPDKELELIAKRAWYMMENDHDGLIAVEAGEANRLLGHRLRTVLTRAADWFFYASLVLAAVGLPAFFRGRRPGRLFVVVAMLSLIAVPLGLWGNPRFHLPVLPFVAMAAAVPLTRLAFCRAHRTRAARDRREESAEPASVGT